MTIDNYIENLEENLSNRILEVTHLKNIISLNTDENKEKLFIKSGVLMLYAHVEGFLKDSLLDLIQFLNRQDFKVEEMIFRFRAISLDKEFNNLEELGKDRGIFKRDFPEKKHLKKVMRREFLLSEIDKLLSKNLVLDAKVINLESNVGYEVLERNFFKLSISIESLEKYRPFLGKLIGKRNDIAHNGLIEENITTEDYNNILEETKNF